jgi:hypothetical protein
LVNPEAPDRSNASVIHSALEDFISELSSDGLKAHLRAARFCIVNDVPDNVSANKRRQHKIMQLLADEDGALYFSSGCAAHLVHRVVVQSTGESKLVGHVYAVAFSLSVPGHRNKMHQALWSLIDDHLQISVLPPDPEWARHQRAIISHTVRRKNDHVRGSLFDSDAVFVGSGESELEKSEELLRTYLNGDLRSPVLTHHCIGCCASVKDRSPDIDPTLQTHQQQSQAVEVGFFYSRPK